MNPFGHAGLFRQLQHLKHGHLAANSEVNALMPIAYVKNKISTSKLSINPVCNAMIRQIFPLDFVKHGSGCCQLTTRPVFRPSAAM